ncbi:hypothetical protein AC1031_018496 [Aphanomyces cochlioides]|nr:hypothetical protein AC1031_018496 [Aphanomyces cochlioides]
MEYPKWRAATSLAVGGAVMLSIGSSYAISSWNAQLKDLLSLDQSQITTVNSSLSFGLYLAFIPGIFNDHYGVRATTIVATMLLPLLYFLAYLQASSILSGSVWLLALTFGLLGLVSQFAGMACITSSEGNYGASHRGKVLGFVLSCFGAGGAVFAFIYHTFFDHHVASFFVFMAILSVVVCSFGVVFLLPNRHHDSVTGEDQPLLSPTIDMTGVALVSDKRFWLLFVPTMIGIGSGLLVNANLAFIVEARHGSATSVPILIALFSICNVSSRLIVGAASDASADIVHRGHYMSSGLLAMAGAYLSFLWGTPLSLFFSVPLAGIAEGCLFPTYTALTRELFGARHFGKNFGYMTLANAVGFPLLLGPFASYVYHGAATIDPVSGIEKCVGPSCFNPTFLAVAAANAAAVGLSSQLYRSDALER